jgi:hypothetical protein
MSIEYKFFYCLTHDDGCCAPEGVQFNPCCVSDRTVCDFVEMGTLSFDGREIRVINPVYKNYNRYGGGFDFKYFASEVLDSNGNRLTNHPVIDWILERVNQRPVAH